MLNNNQQLSDEKISSDILKYFLNLIEKTLNSSHEAINQITYQIKELIQYTTSGPTKQEMMEKISKMFTEHDAQMNVRLKDILHKDLYSHNMDVENNKLDKLIENDEKLNTFSHEFDKRFESRNTEVDNKIKKCVEYLEQLSSENKELLQKINKVDGHFKGLFWAVGMILTIFPICYAIIEFFKP